MLKALDQKRSLTAIIVMIFALSCFLSAQITLSPSTSPLNAQSGVTTVSVTGSGFPNDSIVASSVQVLLASSDGKNQATTTATSFTSIAPNTARVSFLVPRSVLVWSSTSYKVSVSGKSSSGISFSSTNTASLTIDPASSILLTPGQAGNGTLSVNIVGNATNFVQGSTSARFGPGVSVGTGTAGAFGQVSVTGPTTATAVIRVDQSAAPGPRSVQVASGTQESSTTFTITSNQNSGPIANAGPQQYTQVGKTVFLNGSKSTSGSGVPLTFQWTFDSVPSGSTASLTNASSPVPSFVVDKAGSYVVKLTVSDGTYSTSASTRVSTSGTGPTAKAGYSQLVSPGSAVLLDGSGSSDPDGDVLVYQWSFLAKPLGTTAALSDSNSVAPTFTPDVAGTYVLQLAVNDGHGNTAVDTVTISSESVPLFVDAGPNQVVSVGTTAHLDGSLSSSNAGAPISFAWSFLVKPSGSAAALFSPTTAFPQFTVDVPGTYVVQAAVTDGFGQKGFGTVVVSTGNLPPKANAGGMYNLPSGNTIQLDGSKSSDLNGHPLSYSWALISKPVGSSAALSHPTAVNPYFDADLPGFYVVQLIVSDGIFVSTPDTVLVTAALPVVSVTPPSLQFGSQIVHLTSDSNSVKISNSGTGNLVISNLALSGAQASEFTFSAPSLPITVPPGGNATVNVSATPNSTGARSATLSISDNAYGSPHTVALSSLAVQGAPIIGLQPNPVDFGAQPVNNASTPVPVTVTNSGTADLVVSAITISGSNSLDFSYTSPSLPFTVAPGNRELVNVMFTPSGTGSRSASLNFLDNSSGSPHAVNLTGVGSIGILTLNPNSIRFPDQSALTVSAPIPITITNSGSGPATIRSLALSPATSAFQITSDALPLTIPAGGTATVSVTFAPPTLGFVSTSLIVTSSAIGSPQSIGLSGTGTAASISFSPTSVNFGSQNLDTSSTPIPVTITNSGSGNLTISNILITGANAGEFTITGNTTATLAAGASTTLSITFKPNSAGNRNGLLSVVDSAPGSPHSVPLSGVGTVSGAGITLSPPTLTFASQQPGTTSASQQVTVTNTGASALTISGISITGLNSSEFSFTPAFSSNVVLSSGASATYNVTFTPSSTGTRSAALTFVDNVAGSPHVVGLTGTGAGAAGISVAPGSLAFGEQKISTASAQKSAVITNIGSAPLTISSVTISGLNSFDFSWSTTGNLPLTIAPNGTLALNVTFTPVGSGSRTANLNISSNASGTPTVVTLSGTGTQPIIGINPSPVNFGSQPVTTTSGATALTISNTGSGTLQVSALALSGANASEFTLTPPSLPASIPSGGNAVVNITFTPAQTGSRTATLTITDNAGGPHTVTINGTGTSTGPAVGLTPSTINFGNQSLNTISAATPVAITNTGVSNLTIQAITMSGNNSSDFIFSLASGQFPLTLAPGAMASVNVSFKPTGSGARSAILNVTDNASDSPQKVTLSGTGVVPLAQVTPASLSFGNQPQSTTSTPQQFTITNSGTGPLTVTSVMVTGTNPSDFAVTPNSNFTVAAGSSTNVSVTFTPNGTGFRTATININDNATGSPQSVTVSGTGTASTTGVQVSPLSLTFSSQAPGTTSAPQPVTVTNLGSTAVTISNLAITGTNSTEFTLTNGLASFSIPGNGSATLSVTFTPTASGSRAATLNFVDSATNSPHPVTLTGTGGTTTGGPQISFNPTSLSFGNQQVNSASAPLPLVISNPGSSTLTILSITTSGSNSGDFAFGQQTFPLNIAAGATATINVVFTPQGTGLRTANLVTSDNASGNLHTVALSGTGAIPLISLNTTTLNFGNQPAFSTSSPMTLTVTNQGSGALVISNVQVIPGSAVQFNFNAPARPITVPPNGGTATITATFSPTATGSFTASLYITDNATGSPHIVTLTGNGTAPSVSISPSIWDFGTQAVSTTGSNKTFLISNNGSGDLNISNIALTGSNPGDFVLTAPATPLTISSGSSAVVSVAFKPTLAGSRSASLSITDNVVGSPHSVALTGTGVGPGISINPTAVTFNNQSVGTTSNANTVTISNTGTANLIISSMALSGANAGDFSITPNGSSQITVGSSSSTIVSIKFTPSGTGLRTATLAINDNATGSPHTVTITGTGVAPTFSAGPNPLVFANQQVLSSSSPLQITVTNTGDGVLSITGLTLSGANAGDFSVSPSPSAGNPIIIASNGSAPVSVIFTPTATGTRTANLNFTDNATGSPHTVAISGTAVTGGIGIAPASITFPDQVVLTSGTAVPVTITNTGLGNLVISSLGITGTNAADFSSNLNAPPNITITPGNSTVVNINFTPSSSGARSALLTIVDNVAGSPHTVALSGNGVPNTPSISIAPPSLSFGTQAINSPSAPLPITITNSGNGVLTVSGLSFTGANATDFGYSASALPLQIAKGNSATINITFTPGGTGARSATLNISDNVSPGLHTVGLSGTGAVPGINFSSSSINFGNQLVGVASAPTQVTITNNGAANLVISSITPTGANAGDFTTNFNPASGTLTPGQQLIVAITFKPNATGNRSASLAVADNVTGSPQTIALAGVGIQPAFSIVPSTGLNFSTQSPGSPSVPQTLTVTNTGSADLVISSLSLSGSNPGDFNVTPPGPVTIVKNTSATFSVTFTPGDFGNRSASLVFNDNAPGNPHTIPLTGVGANPGISVPASLSFGNQLINTTSAVNQVIVSSTGTAALNVSSVTITGANASEFTITSGTTFTVNPGSTSPISITFRPTDVGPRTATLNIVDNATGSPHTVTLNGTGTGPTIGLNPVSIDFGQQAVNVVSGAIPITVSNSGTGNLTISAIAISGANASDFTFTAGTLPLTVAPNSTVTINVTFKPLANTARSATLSITDNAAGSPQTVPLAGTGTAPVFGIAPQTVPFADQLVGTTSAAQTVAITNTGNATLSITGVALSGANAAEFAFNPPTPTFTVAAGATYNLSVTLSPSTAGNKTATLTVTEAGNIAHPVTLTGKGVAPQISVTSPFNFGSQNNGTPATLNLTIGNSGTAPLTISNLAISGTNASLFAIGSGVTLPIVIQPGANTPLPLVFTSDVDGVKTATLTITDDAAGSPHNVTLNGTGTHVPAQISLPTTVLFSGSIPVNTSATPQTVGISNPGTVPLVISNITLGGNFPGDFSFSAPALPFTVNAGSTTNITVNFKPTNAGNRAATLNFTDNTTAGTHSVILQGNGQVSGQLTLPSLSIGYNLEAAVVASMSTNAPNDTQVTLTSTNGSLVLLSTDPAVAGSTSITVTVPQGLGQNGFGFPVFYIQGLAASGSAQINVTAAGYTSNPATVTLTPAGFIIGSPDGVGQNFNTTTQSGATAISVIPARLNIDSSIAATNGIRIRGGISINVPVTSATQAVGTISGSPAVVAGGSSSGSVSFNPLSAGTSVLTAIAPSGFATPSATTQITATVAAPTIALNAVTVGANLQTSSSGLLSAAAPAGGLVITITSDNPNQVRLSTSSSIVGTSQIQVTVPAGSFVIPNFFVHGLVNGGSAHLNVMADGYQPVSPAQNPSSGAVAVVPAGFVIAPTGGNAGDAIATATTANNTGLTVSVYRLDPGTLAPQGVGSIRAGLSVQVPVTSSSTSVGTIVNSPLTFNGTDFQKTNAQFDPLGQGTTTISAGTPSGFSTPSSGNSIVATVTAPSIVLGVSQSNIGKNLQVTASGSLTAGAPSNGFQVTLTSSDPNNLRISSSATSLGGGTLVLTLNQGDGIVDQTHAGLPQFYFQALGSSGTYTVTATAPGYTSATTNVTITSSGFVIVTPNGLGIDFGVALHPFPSPQTIAITAYQLDSGNNPINPQQVRGGLSVPVTINNTPSGVVSLTSPVTVAAGNSSVSDTVNPLSTGTATLSLVTPSGFSTPASGTSVHANTN